MATTSERLSIEALHETGPYDSLADDVRRGFACDPPEIPPKYFYDERGGRLFDAITRLPEYYPTRVETALLERFASEIADRTHPEELLEIGPGSPQKASLLLPSLVTRGLDRYVPFDINRAAIERSASVLLTRWPELRVHGAIGDFTCHFGEIVREGKRLVAFLGGTIGNFTPEERADFLARVREALEPDESFLLGTDLRPGRVKTRERLELAYDDAAGVTAEFNKNVLAVLNRELDGTFEPDAFEHRAPYDVDHGRIEMHLVASRAMTARLDAIELEHCFAPGDHILTELSYKFDREGIERDLEGAGLELTAWLTDPDELFALSLARPRRP